MKKLILFALLWHIAPLLWAQFGGGDGITSETAFQISSVEHLVTLATNVNAGTTYVGSFFKQMNDIDLNVNPYNTGNGWIPVGILYDIPHVDNKPFKGNYNGQGYAVRNLFVNSTTSAGLFGMIEDATIINLSVSNANITGGYGAGALVAFQLGSVINNCISSGTVNSGNNAGGLSGVSMFSSSFANCSSSCNVTGTGDYFGGLTGQLGHSSTMSYCLATGDVSGVAKVGGLAGSNYQSTIANCYALGSVSGSGEKIGGLLGDNNNGSNLSNSFSVGAVAGGTLVGGLVGFNHNSTVYESFWDISTSGQSTSAGGVGRTTALMKTLFTFMRAAWDFKGEAGNGSNEIWNIGNSRNDGYPYLSWQYPSDDGIKSGTVTAPATGDGSPADPYQIASLENLNWITENTSRWGHHYIQTSNIDASSTSTWNNGEGWMPIGNPVNFTGSYNGQDYAITGLYINRPAANYMGLFGGVSNAPISNLSITGVNFTGNAVVGALIAVQSFSSIENCHSSGSVTGSGNYIGGLTGISGATSGSTSVTGCSSGCTVQGASYVGGLAGMVRNSTIDLCNATGVVSGTGNFVGGLAGQNYISTIKRSYATGAVSGVSYVGGLAGQNYTNAVIEDCYATGYISGTESAIGGLAGANLDNSSITRSFASGNVSGPDGVGGLLGVNNPTSVISNSYSKGNVVRSTGSSVQIASFVGICYGTASNCYSTGSVTYNDEASQPTNKGFSGFADGSFTANFFDQTTSGQTSGEWATAKTTAQMKTLSTFTDAGWDFVGETTNGTNDIWDIDNVKNDGYPFFTWQVFDDPGNTVPENLTVSNSLASDDLECFNALNQITVAGNGETVIIPATAEATFIAGQSILFLPGFHAEAGSYVDAHITTSGEYCNFAPPAPIVQAEAVVEKSIVFDDYIDDAQEPFAEKQIKLYPNPNNGRFTLQLSNFDSPAKVLVVNLVGKVMHQATINEPRNFEIDMLNAPRGVYTVVVNDNEIVKTIKMVVY